MNNRWRDFWQSYRKGDASSEHDLFYQVGKTIAGKPISDDVFRRMVEAIKVALDLRTSDHLYDMCCGNGLVTMELADSVRRITAVDFASHLIMAARAYRSAANIEYVEGDILAKLNVQSADSPNKFLMNDALAYFDPTSFAQVLDGIMHAAQGTGFRLLVTGIPDDAKKWSFYDTPERRARFLANQHEGDGMNDGLGRWWSVSEVERTCLERDLQVMVGPQPEEVSLYRMDALIWWG